MRGMVSSFLVRLYGRPFLSFHLVRYKRGSICPSLQVRDACKKISREKESKEMFLHLE